MNNIVLNYKYMSIPRIISFAVFALFVYFALFPSLVFGARLSLEPTAGTFVVGSTFSVSIFLDTEDELVNAIEVNLSFSPNKLQVISASTGFSIVNTWAVNPNFNNREGKINLQGVIPSGIYADKGLITTVTFRTKAVGSALIKFTDESRIFLSDGKGTDALYDVTNGVYQLILPPPSGPIVVSETHPDQSKWYPNSSVILKWANGRSVEGYSYILSSEPIDTPDKILEGTKKSIVYKNLANETHYFHIRALRNGVWGGISHFALNIDTEPPAIFSMEVSPSKRTMSKNPIIGFQTTDALSGIDYYEYKIVSLKPDPELDEADQNFFIEAQSPQVLNLELGNYDVIVRVYDKAGNFREVTERLKIITRASQIINSFWTWVIIVFLIIILGYGLRRLRNWHHETIARSAKGKMPDHVEAKLRQLKKYQQRYGHLVILLLLLGSLWFVPQVKAQQIELSPPLISSVSRNISNEDIFYIGGKTDAANIPVIIYLQNLQTGETLSQNVTSNKKGEWFYRHPTFLSTGNYLLWAQTKFGDQLSPPSPQIQMGVRSTAIQFGASRLSLESIYLIAAIILFIVVIVLITFNIFHFRRGHRKHRQFRREVREAEESIRRGFAILRRDIEAELAIVQKAKLNKALSAEGKKNEEQLLRDLNQVQEHIGKEIWDIKKMDHLD